MKEIQLTRGKSTMVDDGDYEYLMQWKWFAANPKADIWYAVRTDNKNKARIRMHRVILGSIDSKEFVDHKDHNGLNNQRSNLRKCTRSENAKNRRSSPTSTSKYLGVCWHKSTKKWFTAAGEPRESVSWFWYATIGINGKVTPLGTFRDEISAAKAYNEAAKKYHGEFANLNIIEEKFAA